MSAIEIAIESPLAEVAAASEEVDCLVIGSGTAGVTTALVLAERGYRVVILEAGPLLLLGHIGNTQLNQYGVLASKINTSVSYETRWLLRDKCEPENNMRRGETNTAWSVVGGRTIFWSGCAPR